MSIARKKLLVVGLGNHSKRLARTRHNVGTMALHHFARLHNVELESERNMRCDVGVINCIPKAAEKTSECEVFLCVPQTFMNVCGPAIAAAKRQCGIANSSDVLVLCDDITVPFGEVRVRMSGSSGGHNGLKSVESKLGPTYARARIGIDSGKRINLQNFVLETFNGDQMDVLRSDVFPNCDKIIQNWIDGVYINQPPKEKKRKSKSSESDSESDEPVNPSAVAGVTPSKLAPLMLPIVQHAVAELASNTELVELNLETIVQRTIEAHPELDPQLVTIRKCAKALDRIIRDGHVPALRRGSVHKDEGIYYRFIVSPPVQDASTSDNDNTRA